MKTTKIAVYLNAVARKVKPFQISQWTYTFKPKTNQITCYYYLLQCNLKIIISKKYKCLYKPTFFKKPKYFLANGGYQIVYM